MREKKNLYRSFSLVQTVVTVFVVIFVIAFMQSYFVKSEIKHVENEFNKLSKQALPLAMNNAKLTKVLLEELKVLREGMQVSSIEQLNEKIHRVNALTSSSQVNLQLLFSLTHDLGFLASNQQRNELEQDINRLSELAKNIMLAKKHSLGEQDKINDLLPSFRYGLSSIGSEMTRIASFLAVGNPASSDAANRYSAQAAEMESHFLTMLMLTDFEKATLQYKEMKNRIAGIDLAYDDFSEWHPEIYEFSSLTMPFDMVKDGFKPEGILRIMLDRLVLIEAQEKQIQEATTIGNKSIDSLERISDMSHQLMVESNKKVNSAIDYMSEVIIVWSFALAIFVTVAGMFLKAWIKRSLVNVTRLLTRLVEHDYSCPASSTGPRELREISNELNKVIGSTSESIAVVTANSNVLNTTAAMSQEAARKTNESLTAQNDSLTAITANLEQLQESIKEIASTSSQSYNQSQLASEKAAQGSKALEENTSQLAMLERTLSISEKSMTALDSNVDQIGRMVDVISAIAENTNLLALNAAIEAARAGEQGRGFAVVADEVRKLASDTSGQTQSIKNMMEELVSSANDSKKAVEVSREKMAYAINSNQTLKSTFIEIFQSIEQIKQRVEQVSVATQQQDYATADVNQSVAEIAAQGAETKKQLTSMLGAAVKVSNVSAQQQEMLRKYHL
mgnify:CR=1 FL=1